MDISEKLKKLIEEQKKQSFYNPENTSDEDALGVMISKYFNWNGDKIFKTSYSAFEDSNFHEFNETFEKNWNGGN